jgi:23S rRNA (uracil747-C5)-methyltransferase
MSWCPHFNLATCRSCTMIDTPIDKQIKLKESRLRAITQIPIEQTVSLNPKNFRDKIKLTVSGSVESPQIGILQGFEGVEILDCPIQAETLNLTLKTLKSFITKFNLTPYHILEKKGELKGLIISWSPVTKQMMLRFVLRSKEALDRIRIGLNELSSFHVVSVNLQPIAHAILEGDEEIILTENSFITHQSGDVQIEYGPQGFMQTNLIVANQLYETATSWIRALKIHKVADLFCGSGAFSMHLAHAHINVLGIEINPHAIERASHAAMKQDLKAKFIAAPSENVLSELIQYKPEAILVNPPRRGLGSTKKLIQEIYPQHIFYSSCSVESLAADLEILKDLYQVQKAQIFDMFPHTNHFESLIHLKRF